ncbi:MAG: hypothetical protein KatS3mg076_2580 [Candidatus Binatia bacterium]|nr:MAG: hypothetical protein KatS3mg076_2580 [Candidatus Binatia bacterium]
MPRRDGGGDPTKTALAGRGHGGPGPRECPAPEPRTPGTRQRPDLAGIRGLRVQSLHGRCRSRHGLPGRRFSHVFRRDSGLRHRPRAAPPGIPVEEGLASRRGRSPRSPPPVSRPRPPHPPGARAREPDAPRDPRVPHAGDGDRSPCNLPPPRRRPGYAGPGNGRLSSDPPHSRYRHQSQVVRVAARVPAAGALLRAALPRSAPRLPRRLLRLVAQGARPAPRDGRLAARPESTSHRRTEAARARTRKRTPACRGASGGSVRRAGSRSGRHARHPDPPSRPDRKRSRSGLFRRTGFAGSPRRARFRPRSGSSYPKTARTRNSSGTRAATTSMRA